VTEALTSDQIKQAVGAVKALRPSYAGLLDFYEKLFLAQEASKGDIRLEPIIITKDHLDIKVKEKLPLINNADFAIDIKASLALLREIRLLAVEANKVLADAGARLEDALNNKGLDPSDLFSKVLADDDAYFAQTAKDLKADKKALVFITYCSIRPSLSVCAEQLAAYLDKDAPWGKGYCPICGSAASLSILRGEGERFLVCGLCGHEWRSQRIYCPFCDNKDQQTLHYFFSEEEKGYRVDVCDRCKKYIKTVDTREMTHPVYPFVEEISTLHLDMLARDQGLKSGIPLWL
jgi:FdhE protein